MSTLADATRFAVGTFTRVPVHPPSRLDRPVVAGGIALGPLVGAVLGAAGGLPLLVPLGPDPPPAAGILLALMAVGLTAWLTRALHWDGVADLADGLGSGAPPEQARAIMKRSDIGPFGVLALVLVMGTQVLALACLPHGLPALGGWVAAVAAGRLGIALACGPRTRSAAPTGLGATVIGGLGPGHVAVGALVTASIAAACGLAGTSGTVAPLIPAVIALTSAAVVAATLTRIASRRLGGSSGDVLGACAELTTATSLIALVLAGLALA